MPAKPSVYYRPQSLEDALRLLQQPDVKPLSGGTKLIAQGFTGAVVDLQDLGLERMELRADTIELGAMVRLANLAEFLKSQTGTSVREGPVNAGILLQGAIHNAGPNTYRNQATVGGEIASRLPDSEFSATMMVLEATINFADETSMDVVSFMAAYDQPEGLILEVSISWLPGRGISERVARTPADYPIVSVTAFWPEEGGFRLAATGIDERPVRLAGAEEILNTGGSVEDAAQTAKRRARHPGDFRGSAEYRAEMAYVLTRRVLRQLL